MDSSSQSFLELSRQQFLQWIPRLRAAVEPLSPEQLWWRPNQHSNSVANLLLHLNGNVSQWLLANVGGLPYERHRPEEFSARGTATAAELLNPLQATLERAAEILATLSEEALRREHSIQGYAVNGMAAIYHVVEHFSMHYGQILYVAKLLQDRDLGFYAHLNRAKTAQQ